MKKRSIINCFLVVLVFALAMLGCAKSEAEDSIMETEEDTTMEIETSFGILIYPAKWEESVEINETQEEGINNIIFSTKIGEEEYILFTLSVGEKEGDIVGTLTDIEGNENDVYVEVTDLGDISELSQEDQDKLYAMQEGINVVLENLK